jgi:hypothetical protein
MIKPTEPELLMVVKGKIFFGDLDAYWVLKRRIKVFSLWTGFVIMALRMTMMITMKNGLTYQMRL